MHKVLCNIYIGFLTRFFIQILFGFYSESSGYSNQHSPGILFRIFIRVLSRLTSEPSQDSHHNSLYILFKTINLLRIHSKLGFFIWIFLFFFSKLLDSYQNCLRIFFRVLSEFSSEYYYNYYRNALKIQNQNTFRIFIRILLRFTSEPCQDSHKSLF